MLIKVRNPGAEGAEQAQADSAQSEDKPKSDDEPIDTEINELINTAKQLKKASEFRRPFFAIITIRS